jgi:DNA-binding NarL/FixJ family response regulator
MKILFFSSDIDMVDEWKRRHSIDSFVSCYDADCLQKELENLDTCLLIADYDSVAHDLNKLIYADKLPQNTIVLERVPEIVSGKMLISHGVKAYGNSRMLSIHFVQMIETVTDGKVWTYPELTAAFTAKTNKTALSAESMELINNKLTPKESEVIHLILNGLTNDAIASKLSITPRTVKAHVSAIFTKLHVNDRVSLVLLLK